MRLHRLAVACFVAASTLNAPGHAQAPTRAPAAPAVRAPDPVRDLVEQLDLERYKATIKGLTVFGDRRQGTDRNRAAIDWIEARLKADGCANIGRLSYIYPSASGASGTGAGTRRGVRAPVGANNDPLKQPDATLRALDSQPTAPGPREEVYCTKVGTSHPDEMYIVAAHMDGIGYGEAANDDGSGTALVMEIARILNGPGVETDRSIRFILWNNEETALDGSRAYVAQRMALQGKEDPPGSGRYPEPKWLGMMQHDMMLFDHGMPRAGGTVSADQRPEADVNVEFQVNSKLAAESQSLAWAIRGGQRTVRHRLSRGGRQPHDQHRFDVVPGRHADRLPA